MAGLNDSELVAVALAFFLPLLIAVIQQPRWNDATRALVALVTVFVWTLLAVVVLGQGGGYAWQSALRLLLMVFLVSSVAYLALWRPAGVTQRIEDMTAARGQTRQPALDADDRRAATPTASRKSLTPPPPARRSATEQAPRLRRTRP